MRETIAIARLASSGRGWIVPCCPFCSATHRHGAGGPQDDPRALLGSRQAHCGRGPYSLVEAGQPVSPRFAMRHPEALERAERAGLVEWDAATDLYHAVAERRLGEITAEMEKAAAGRPSREMSATAAPISKSAALASVGIAKEDASRFERIAAIPAARGRP